MSDLGQAFEDMKDEIDRICDEAHAGLQMTPEIYLASVVAPLAEDGTEKASRTFLWQKGTDKVSILQYGGTSYIGRTLMSASDARSFWSLLVRQGWTVKIRKAPAERFGGTAIRNEINRIIAGTDPLESVSFELF